MPCLCGLQKIAGHGCCACPGYAVLNGGLTVAEIDWTKSGKFAGYAAETSV